jgi:hypothetical protein
MVQQPPHRTQKREQYGVGEQVAAGGSVLLSAETYGRMVSPARDFLQSWATAAVSLAVAGLG